VAALPASVQQKMEAYLDDWWQAEGLEATLKPRVQADYNDDSSSGEYGFDQHTIYYNWRKLWKCPDSKLRHIAAHEGEHARQFLFMSALWQQAPDRAERSIRSYVRQMILHPKDDILINNMRESLIPNGTTRFIPHRIEAPRLSNSSKHRFEKHFFEVLDQLQRLPEFDLMEHPAFCALEEYSPELTLRTQALAQQMPELQQQYASQERASQALLQYTEALVVQYRLRKKWGQIPPEVCPQFPPGWLTPLRQREAEGYLRDVGRGFTVNWLQDYDGDPKRSVRDWPNVFQYYAVGNLMEFNARKKALAHSAQRDPELSSQCEAGQNALKLARRLAALQRKLDKAPLNLPNLQARDAAIQHWENHGRPVLFAPESYQRAAGELAKLLAKLQKDLNEHTQQLNRLCDTLPHVSPLLPEEKQRELLDNRTLEEAQMHFLESARAYQKIQQMMKDFKHFQKTCEAVPQLSEAIELTYEPEAKYQLNEQTQALLDAYEQCLAEFDQQVLQSGGFVMLKNMVVLRHAQQALAAVKRQQRLEQQQVVDQAASKPAQPTQV
jgi:hypothetical protein